MDAYEIDFREIVMLNIKVLTFFGIFSKKSKSLSDYVNRFARLAILTGLFGGGLLLAQLAKWVLSFQKGIEEVVTASYLTLTNFLTAVKVIFVFINRKRILALIFTLNRKEFKPRNFKQCEILAKYIKISKILTTTMLVSCNLILCLWSLYPLTIKGGHILPIVAYVPYKTDNQFVFGFTYFVEVIGITAGGCCGVTVDGLITGLIMVICAHLSLLNDSLKNMYKYSLNEINKSTGKNNSDVEKSMGRNFLKCVHQHQFILGFAEEVESIFTICIFGQFLLSVLVLCSTLFKLDSMEKSNIDFLSLVVYVFVMVTEVFGFCYFGNEVISKNNELTNSAYFCDWLHCSKDFRNNLIFFMIRTQKLLRLVGGRFIILSLETFVTIIKSSVSYYTVLNQINDV